MNNLLSIYLGCIPFVALLFHQYLYIHESFFVKMLTFYYSYAVFNFVCGYHWTLSMTSLNSYSRLSSLLLSLSSLVCCIIFSYDKIIPATLGLSALSLMQLSIDFYSDVTASIPVAYRVARLVASTLMITTLCGIIVVRS